MIYRIYNVQHYMSSYIFRASFTRVLNFVRKPSNRSLLLSNFYQIEEFASIHLLALWSRRKRLAIFRAINKDLSVSLLPELTKLQ